MTARDNEDGVKHRAVNPGASLTMTGPVTVGRDAELATVRTLVEATAAGTGAALMVRGEAGIGKSRLLDELAARARATGMVVLAGRAVQGGGTYRAPAEALLAHLRASRVAESTELRPYRAALRRVLPGWVGDDGTVASELAVDPVLVLGEGVLALLRAIAGARGCLLCLEDLHWADDDTLALVAHLAGAVAGSPVLVAVSARDDERAAAVDRLALVPGMTTLRPARLDGPQIATLVASRRGGRAPSDAEVADLLARADGIPSLIEQLADTAPGAGGAVPPTLAGLVEARIGALTRSARTVLVVAAVLGGDPDADLLGAVCDQPEPAVVDALRAGVDAALLVSAAGRLRWRHALTRDAVLSIVLPPERAGWARRAAAALAARGRPDDELRAAELFETAGDPDRAAALLLARGRRDTARGALRGAEALLTRAAGLRADPGVAAGILVELVGVQVAAGNVGAALERGDAALDGLAGDDHAELCLRLAKGAVVAARYGLAEAYVERAGRPDDPRSALLCADAAFGAGRAEAASALAAAAVDRAERAGASAPLCEALGVTARTALRHDVDAAAAAFRRAAQVAAEHGLTPWRVEALAGLGMVELCEADDSPTLRRARELALDAGMLAQAVTIDVVLTETELVIGGPRAAEPIIRRAAELAERLRVPALLAATRLGLSLCRGAGGAVDAGGERDGAGWPVTGSPDETAYPALARGMACVAAHDLRGAVRWLDEAMIHLLDHESAPPLVHFGLWAVLRTTVADRDAEARDRVRRHPSSVRRVNRAALDYAEAIAAARAGRSAEAAERFAAADAALAGQHWWRRLLRLLALDAAVADGWGNPIPELRSDLRAHEEDGDSGRARTCRDLLRRAGAPTRRGRGTGPVPPSLRALGVTSREADVLALVVQGLSNAAIAQRLYLSIRTVESHVARLLAKTGAANRAELRDRAVAQTP